MNETLKDVLNKHRIFALYIEGEANALPREEWDKYLDCPVWVDRDTDYDEEGQNRGVLWGIILSKRR